MTRNTHIIIAEPASLVFQGLSAAIFKSNIKAIISRAESLDEILKINIKKKAGIIIINPSFLQNNIKDFNTIRTQIENASWIGLVYAYHEQQILSLFDSIITISDTPEFIISVITKAGNKNDSARRDILPDVISDREIDVLKLLASGMANKEIADKLNISINTVITHRKNISQKTGIKSVSGLTIYAVLKKLIPLETLSN